MKRFFYLLLAVAMLASFGCSGDTTVSSSQQGTDTISGVLRDPATNAPIAGAVIKNGNATCTTDAQGMWTLGGFIIPTGGGADAATNNLQFIVSVVPPTGKGYPAQVFRTIFGSATAINNVTVGKLNATVKGRIVNADGSAAVGATVYLTYGTDSDTLGTAAGTVYTFNQTTKTVTDANGIFSIANVETGARVVVIAQSADGAFSGLWPANNTLKLANTDNFTNNLNAQWTGVAVAAATGQGGAPFMFGAVTDLNLPLVTLAPTISIKGGAFAGGLNNGEFAAGATVVRFALNKAIPQNAYTSSVSFTNDLFVGSVAKGGNVPFTVEFVKNSAGSITAIDVKFTTGVSQIYTINLGDRTDTPDVAGRYQIQAGSLLAKLGVATGVSANGFNRVVFATDSGSTPVAAPAPKVPNQGKSYLGDGAVAWDPVAGANAYRIFVSKTEAGVSTGYIMANAVDANGKPIDQAHCTFNLTAFINTLPVGSVLYNGGPTKSIYFNGLNTITYSVKVYALGTDKVLSEAKAGAVTCLDKTKVQAATTAKPNFAAFTTTGKTAATAQTFAGNLFADDQQVTVGFFADPTVLTLQEQMDKASVEGGTLGIVPAVAGTYLGTLTASGPTALNSGNVAYKLVVTSFSYNQNTMSATLKYNIKYTINAPAAAGVQDVAGTTYTITPVAGNYRFTLTGAKDINGNALAYYDPAGAPVGF